MTPERNALTRHADDEHPMTPWPTNLPAQLSSLIDRDQELQFLAQRLLDPACRLLTITGAGGVGKTHLVLAAAQRLLAAQPASQLFTDGLYFVDLAETSTGEQMVSYIGRTLRFQFDAAGDAAEQLTNYLRSRHLLLILDNVEQLVNDSPFFTTLLQGAPGLKLLTTSRERLNLEGEWLLEVGGLPVEPYSPVHPGPTTESAGYAPAIALFIRVAQAVQPNFSAQNEAVVINQICRYLDGLPLGIQLAAGALRTYTCSQILTGLQENSDIISTQLRNTPARHRTLRAVFMHSWALLTPAEQKFFQQLAVFAGGFNATAASAVTGAVAGANVALLDALVDKSLLQRSVAQTDAPATEYRFQLHHVLRQFAAEGLAVNQSLQSLVRERHGLYYSQLLQERGRELNGKQGAQALAILYAEQENIDLAWQWAASGPALAALEQSISWYVAFYLFQSPLAQLQTRLEDALAHVEPLVHSTSARTDPAHTVLALLLNALAQVHNERGNYALALTTAQRAARVAQENRRNEIEGEAYLQWGRVHFFQGHYDEAQQRLSMALTIALSGQNKRLTAAAHHILGTNRLYRGDYATGQDYYHEALRLYTELGDAAKVIQVRYNMALVLFYSGDYLAAGAVFAECIDAYRQRGELRAIGLLLNNLGAVYTQLGDYPKAAAYYEEALASKRSLGDRPYESLILANLGLVAANRQDFQLAANHCRAALQISQELGERATTAYAQTCLGYAVAGLGWLAEAVALFTEALQLREALGQADQMLEPLAGLAAIYLNQDQPHQALSFVEQILPHLQRLTAAGVVDPMRIFWTCYQVLAANRDLRATDVLATAQTAIQVRAAKIPDERLRIFYCENVLVHRQILAAYADIPKERRSEQANKWRTRMDEHTSLAADLDRLLHDEDE